MKRGSTVTRLKHWALSRPKRRRFTTPSGETGDCHVTGVAERPRAADSLEEMMFAKLCWARPGALVWLACPTRERAALSAGRLASAAVLESGIWELRFWIKRNFFRS